MGFHAGSMLPPHGDDVLFGLDFASEIERRPVSITTPEAVSTDDRDRLRCLCDAQGFAFFRVAPEIVSPQTMAGIADSLGLGLAFVFLI
jgi:hypothetical protein